MTPAPRPVARLGHEVVCSSCHIGTMREYPVLAGGRTIGHVTRCSWCHRTADAETHDGRP